MSKLILDNFDIKEDKSFILFNVVQNYLLNVKKMTKDDLKKHLKEIYNIEYADWELNSFLDSMTEDGILKSWGNYYALPDYKIFDNDNKSIVTT